MNTSKTTEVVRFRWGQTYAEPAHPGADGPGVYVAKLDGAHLEHGLDPIEDDHSGERVCVEVKEDLPGSAWELCCFTLAEWARLVSEQHRR